MAIQLLLLVQQQAQAGVVLRPAVPAAAVDPAPAAGRQPLRLWKRHPVAAAPVPNCHPEDAGWQQLGWTAPLLLLAPLSLAPWRQTQLEADMMATAKLLTAASPHSAPALACRQMRALPPLAPSTRHDARAECDHWRTLYAAAGPLQRHSAAYHLDLHFLLTCQGMDTRILNQFTKTRMLL